MMENHAYGQIVNNPDAPFANEYMKSANAAKNYFAVAHPSLTNYLEVVGGSNFGVQTDNSPSWHDTACMTTLATAIVATDVPASTRNYRTVLTDSLAVARPAVKPAPLQRQSPVECIK